MSFLFVKRAASVLGIIAILGTLMIANPSAAQGSSIVADTDIGFDIDCKSAILMDARTGTVLYEHNADEPLPPASVTKIMTLLLVMEEIEAGRLKYDDTVTVSAHAASMGGSQVYLKEGERMSAEDMIKSVVISSANDAAVALAEHVSGSEELFVQKMNDRARELGMKNTHFENTNGLDDTAIAHRTSARDIAIMSRALLEHEDILKYSSTWMDSIRNGAFTLTNTNRLVRFYEGATGLKTGSTSKAGFCVSATAKRGNMHLICVIMGAESSDVRNATATKLLNWGFSTYELYEDYCDLSPLRVRAGLEDECPIAAEPFAAIVKRGSASRIEKSFTVPEYIDAPVQRGDEIGQIEYTLDGKSVGSASVRAEISVEKIDFWGLFLKILAKFLIK